jgi:hypothetical protein
MIHQVYYTGETERTQSAPNKGDGGPLNLDYDSITLHIADYHGEYQLPTNPPRTPNGVRARVDTLIDASRLEDLMGEEETNTYLSHMPQQLQDVYGDTHIYVHELYGTFNQLLWIFNHFCNRLFRAPYTTEYEGHILTISTPSGDDDTFDYWPSAVTMAYQLACDLDTLRPDCIYVKDDLKARYERHVKKYGEIDEYSPDWEVSA